MNIVLPPKAIQSKIADLLCCIEDRIKINTANLKYNLGIKDNVAANEYNNIDNYSELGPIIRYPGEKLPENGPDVTAEQPKEEPTIEFNPKAPGVIEGFKYCLKCGNRLPADANYCDRCGFKTDY